jgi:precorrin-3B synthase
MGTHDSQEVAAVPTVAVPDRCPGVLRLHQAADGWLARVRLPGGRIDPAALRTLAGLTDAAIECSARASLQLRGLSPDQGDVYASILTAAGLLPSRSHERVRNIIQSPVAGRDRGSRVATDPVVAALDAELCAQPALAQLSGRFLFAVDDGSATLDSSRADLILTPTPSGERLRLSIGTLITDLTAEPADAAALIVAAACAFVAEWPGATGVRSLPDGGRSLVASLDAAVIGRSAAAAALLSAGARRQRDGRMAVTASLPLGRLTADATSGLAALADECGTDIRFSTDRTATLVDLDPTAAGAVIGALESLGLVARPSGWLGLTACAGTGACAKALVDVRAGARARAARRAPGAVREHWSACSRRCGHPVGETISVTAQGPGELVVCIRPPSAPAHPDRSTESIEDVRAAVTTAGLDAVRVQAG